MELLKYLVDGSKKNVSWLFWLEETLEYLRMRIWTSYLSSRVIFLASLSNHFWDIPFLFILFEIEYKL